MREFDKIASLLPVKIRDALLPVDESIKRVAMEIRLIRNSPLVLTTLQGRLFIDKNGKTVSFREGLSVTEKDISETALRISDFSYYAHEKDIERGFITLTGGHRVGLAGRGEEIGGKTVLREIFSLNFRIAKEIDGASFDILPIIINPNIKNTLILSPPCGGKTTVLRDIAKNLSSLKYTVSAVDCRGELSMGRNMLYGCDVLEGYSKRDGILHSLRFLSPEIILCDEITSLEEVSDIESGMNSGVNFIVTAHASDIEDAKLRSVTAALLKLFDIAVILKGRNSPGKIKEVISLA